MASLVWAAGGEDSATPAWCRAELPAADRWAPGGSSQCPCSANQPRGPVDPDSLPLRDLSGTFAHLCQHVAGGGGLRCAARAQRCFGCLSVSCVDVNFTPRELFASICWVPGTVPALDVRQDVELLPCGRSPSGPWRRRSQAEGSREGTAHGHLLLQQHLRHLTGAVPLTRPCPCRVVSPISVF